MNSSLADIANLGRFFEKYRDRLLAMLEWRLDPRLRSRIGAEEILQEAFLTAHKEWPRFLSGKPPDGRIANKVAGVSIRNRSEDIAGENLSGISVYGWLRRQAIDSLIEAWRKHSREIRDIRKDMPLPEASAMHLGIGLLGRNLGPSTSLGRKEVCELVRNAIQQLKEIDREILFMRMVEELSHAEIADALNISIDAACARYARALERFRKIWIELHPDFGSLP